MKAFVIFLALSLATLAPAAEKIRVLLFTGGHGFAQEPFFKIFADNGQIIYVDGGVLAAL